MEIEWDTKVKRRYYDEQTNQWVDVNIMTKDAIFFELLLNILRELKKNG